MQGRAPFMPSRSREASGGVHGNEADAGRPHVMPSFTCGTGLDPLCFFDGLTACCEVREIEYDQGRIQVLHRLPGRDGIVLAVCREPVI